MQREFIRDINFSVGDIVVWCNENTQTEQYFLVLSKPKRQINPDVLSADVFNLQKNVKSLFGCQGNEFNLSSGTWLKVIHGDTCEYYFAPMGCGRPFGLYGK